MEEADIAMLILSSATVDLPEHLKRLADDEDWWERLEGVSVDRLDKDQREMISLIAPELLASK